MEWLCFALAMWFGWILRGQRVKEEIAISVHNQMIKDAFDRYFRITGEYHNQDPRNPKLHVIDLSVAELPRKRK